MRKLRTIIPTILLSCLVTTGCLAEPQTVFEFSGATIDAEWNTAGLKHSNLGSRPEVCDFRTENPCIVTFGGGFKIHITHDADQEEFALTMERGTVMHPYHSSISMENMEKGISISQPDWTRACECWEFSSIEALTLNMSAKGVAQ